jgi:hypothetical protein
MSVVVRHPVFGVGELVHRSSDEDEVALVVWNIEQKSWVKHGWYDLCDEEFTVEGARELRNDGARILSALRRKTSS